MKNLFCFVWILLVFGLICVPDFYANNLMLANRIEGQVYDQNRVPVSDADVELLNEVGSLLSHTKTTSSGRFSFFGLSSGRFTIKVLAFRLNLLEQTQDVEITNLTRTGSDTEYIDFYLRYDKRRNETITPSGPPEAIFVQDIPKESSELYKKGVSDLEKSPDKAFAEVEEAIKIFPNYFDALSWLGKEYVNRKDYQKGYPYLLRAIDLNPRSFSSYYSLGYAFLKLNQIPAAVKAAQATVTLNASSVYAQILYGTVLRLDGNYKESEQTLLKAKSLAKKPEIEIYWQLALLYNKLNRNKEAADELETYLKISPDSPDKKKVQDLIAKLRNSK